MVCHDSKRAGKDFTYLGKVLAMEDVPRVPHSNLTPATSVDLPARRLIRSENYVKQEQVVKGKSIFLPNCKARVKRPQDQL